MDPWRYFKIVTDPIITIEPNTLNQMQIRLHKTIKKNLAGMKVGDTRHINFNTYKPWERRTG